MHFSDYTFFSGGVLAEEGIVLPGITKDFATSLRLPYVKVSSNNVRSQKQKILEADLLLAADDLTCQMLEEIYPEKRFLSIEGRAREMGVALVDPVNTVGYEFNHLLGRFLHFGFSSFRELEGHLNHFPITALIANEDNIYSELVIHLESLSMGDAYPLIVDCNFKFATKREYLGLLPNSRRYDANSMLKLSEKDLGAISLIGPTHEVTSWEILVSSPEWRRWLIDVSRTRPILLLCTPVDIIAGENHNSFLEALNADRLIYRA
jgi:hypothetical protein